MERLFKWLLPALIAIEAILVWSGLVDLRTAVGLVVGIEVLLMLVASRQIFAAVRRYRQNRATGLEIEAAIEDSLAVLMPRKLARLIALEPVLWSCLVTWLFRRQVPEASSFAYRKRSILGALMIVVLVSAPVEILLFELLIPWSWLRWLLLAVSIYAVFWMLGLYASLVVRPHRLGSDAVRLSYGVLAQARIPYGEIRRVEQVRRSAPGEGDGLRIAPNEHAAYLAVSGKTDAVLELWNGHPVSALLGPSKPVTTIYLAVDEPERFVREIQRRLMSDPEPATGTDRTVRSLESMGVNTSVG